MKENESRMSEQTSSEQGGSDGPGTYWVRMVVSTEVEANDYADALQKGCDVVHGLVMENRLGVHTIDAERRPR